MTNESPDKIWAESVFTTLNDNGFFLAEGVFEEYGIADEGLA
eukprot:CAMPEP_0202965646 /NCGR_PEP_ID=MMETSP1396-20130829/9563_1 /ASSEMBLY_ACC=CAM_ASM_000872 /TAXON_ID= /ORGANISM="Pseudokeronopsis sp., Strain Brazil" /LENGTH=41 /DNA_ID= /DNA_START= /DNA_END= /DNA_ORIENTATION=